MERSQILDRGPGPGPLLSLREAAVLRLVVETHIREARPVGSHHLVRNCGLKVSPATVRSVMSSLAERHLLDHRHPSAGRAPTSMGYRYYVDHLMPAEEAGPRARRVLEEQLRRHIADRRVLLSNLADVTGQLSRQLGLVLVAHASMPRITTFDLIPLSPRRIVALLGLEGQTIRTLVLQLDRDILAGDLDPVRSMLSRGIVGRDLVEARRVLEEQIRPALKQHRDRLDEIAAQLPQLLIDDPECDLIIGSPEEIAMQAEFAKGERLRGLLRLLGQQRLIVRTLTAPAREEGVRVRIGSEMGEPGLEEMTTVSVDVKAPGGTVVLGLLGPIRMNYPQAVSLMGWLASRLREVL